MICFPEKSFNSIMNNFLWMDFFSQTLYSLIWLDFFFGFENYMTSVNVFTEIFSKWINKPTQTLIILIKCDKLVNFTSKSLFHRYSVEKNNHRYVFKKIFPIFLIFMFSCQQYKWCKFKNHKPKQIQWIQFIVLRANMQ